MQNRSQSSDLVFGTNEWKQKSSWHIILDTSCDRFLAHLEHHPRAKLIDKPFGFLVFFCRCCAWQLVLKSHGLDDSFTNEPRWDCLFARWSLRCTAELSLIFIFFSDALSPRVLNIHCMPWIIASFVRTEQIIIHAHIWLYMLPLHVPEHIRCNFEVSKFPTNLTMTKVLHVITKGSTCCWCIN